jgi:hypothetical protein
MLPAAPASFCCLLLPVRCMSCLPLLPLPAYCCLQLPASAYCCHLPPVAALVCLPLPAAAAAAAASCGCLSLPNCYRSDMQQAGFTVSSLSRMMKHASATAAAVNQFPSLQATAAWPGLTLTRLCSVRSHSSFTPAAVAVGSGQTRHSATKLKCKWHL